MQLLLPLNKEDKKSFRSSAIEIGFDEFVLHKFLYTVQDSDLDVYQLMHDERISLLIYGWEICQIHSQTVGSKHAVNRNVQTVVKWLACYSMDLWLSKEWESCELQMRKALLYCMRRAEDILMKIPELLMLSWPEILKWDLHPWEHQYISQFVKTKAKLTQSNANSIEQIEQPAAKQDIDYLRDENVFITLLRLVKMIDAFNLEGASQLAMRVIAAWNAIFERARDIPGNTSPQIPKESKQCVVCICHIYLLIVYEMDSNRGFVIDNMMNNIRFYYQGFLEKKFRKPFAAIAIQLNFTPARFIALTCINLNISIDDFFEMFTNRVAERNFNTLYAIYSQSYISYILGNQLMEMNNLNEQHFNAQIERYKNIFNAYLEEREIAEIFLADQLKRQELQRNSHSMSPTITNLTDIKSKFCKGNRSYNIGNCQTNAESAQNAKSNPCSDIKTDAMFENMPNNVEILNYVYEILAKRSYDGWYYAKIILLLKIIGHEVNVIETWRYHPGLTTDFMLGIEIKLSKHYEDLAMIFHEHFFLEQEFWLTAFYLNPIRKYYSPVLRCGMRLQRRLHHAAEATDKICKPTLMAKYDKCTNYGLLSSTIDVKEILKIRNHDTTNADYKALNKSLAALKLSSKTVKDLLTAIFLPRNKSFSWVLDWPELRKRCKRLLKYPELKRRLVELNMAEANDRLKYLHIDYEKYKNRPQLDYGTIEQGYESVMNFTEQQQEDDASDEDDAGEVDGTGLGSGNDNLDDGQRDKGDVDTAALISAEFQQLVSIYSGGARRTRARTAAAIATAKLNIDRARKMHTSKNEEQQDLEKPEKSESAVQTNQITNNSGEELCRDVTTSAFKRNLQELLQERSVFNNETYGFGTFPDIWDFDKNILKTMDTKCAVLKEHEKLYRKVLLLKKTNATKNLHPAGKNLDIFGETTLSAHELDIYEEINTNNNSSKRSKWEVQRPKEIKTSFKYLGVQPDSENVAKIKYANEVIVKDIASSLINTAPDTEKQPQNYRKHDCEISKDDDMKTETMQASSITFLRPKEEIINTTTGMDINFEAPQHLSLASSMFIDVDKNPQNFITSTESPGMVSLSGSCLESKLDLNLETSHHNQVVDAKYGTQPTNETDKRSENSTSNCGRTESSSLVPKHELFAGASVNFYSPVEEFDIVTSEDCSEVRSYESTVVMGPTDDPFATFTNNTTNEVLEKAAIDKLKFKLKEVVVRIKRLKVTDYTKLRQPRVRIRRVGSDSALQSSEGIQRTDSKKSSEDSSKSNKSTLMSLSALRLRPNRKTKYRHKYSDSSEDSYDDSCHDIMSSQGQKLLKTNTGMRQCMSKGHPSGRSKKLVVTPRSASGLKMRISSASTFTTDSVPTSADFISSANLACSNLDNIELIQISSSSSSFEMIESSDDGIHPMTFVRPVLGHELSIDDPLYEEEIIIFD